MQKFLLLCLFFINIFLIEAETWRLYIKKIEIYKKKANKKAWDNAWGKKKAPDLRITIYKKKSQVWKQFYQSKKFADRYTVKKAINTAVNISAGDEIKISILDLDFGRHDLIGEKTITFSEDDIMESQDVKTSFGRVKTFVYFVSKYKTLEEKAKALKNIKANLEALKKQLKKERKKLNKEKIVIKNKKEALKGLREIVKMEERELKQKKRANSNFRNFL